MRRGILAAVGAFLVLGLLVSAITVKGVLVPTLDEFNVLKARVDALEAAVFPSPTPAPTTTTPPPTTAPPSPVEVFGPEGTGTLAERVQAVRDGTVPHAVALVGCTTTVGPGGNISAAVMGAGVGGTICFQKGTYNITAALPTPLANQKWLLESAAGYIRTAADSAMMVGPGEISTGITMVNVVNPGVEIHGGDWSQAWRGIALETTSVLEDAIIHNQYRVGFNFGNGFSRATRVYVHTNGTYNVTANATTQYGSHPTLEYSRVSDGNTQHNDPRNDAGGSKLINTDGMVVQNDWFDGNYGAGIWFDIRNKNAVVRDNVAENNLLWGIFYETSSGGTEIHHNALFNNANNTNDFGTGQLLVSGSDGFATAANTTMIEVHHNLIDGDGTQVQMGTINHAGHGLSRGNYFHDNDVWDRGAAFSRSVGLVTTNGTVPLDPASENRFENNHYHVVAGQTGTTGFVWGESQTIDMFSFPGWQALGHDDTGSLTLIP